MPLTRFLLLAGLMFFSAIAMFMGAAVAINALSTGAISYSFGTGSEIVTRTATLAADPANYWQRLAIFGLLPIVLGAAGIWWGRRTLRAQSTISLSIRSNPLVTRARLS